MATPTCPTGTTPQRITAQEHQPGQAALFMMVRQHASDRGIERLGEKGGRIIRTNLDSTKQAALREAFDTTHKQAVAADRDVKI